jgi:phosphonate transport system permease protein
VRGSLGVAVVALLAVWPLAGFSLGTFNTDRRLANLTRFWSEVVPSAADGSALGLLSWPSWAIEALNGRFSAAVWPTVALSVFAICVAGLLGAVLAIGASRELMRSQPWGPRLPAVHTPGKRRLDLLLLGGAVRALLTVLRAIPTYLWAFVLVLVFGLGAWPAVLAIILHNTGILGKLTAEVIDDLEPALPRAMHGSGASRLQIAALGISPLVFNRFLLYFFVRWETAVREATVLGLLGFVSLGWFIQDARVRMQTDQMVLFVLLGSAIIIVGDLASVVLRGRLRVGQLRA